MRARRHALFHAIVTMGAASVQPACGGVAVDTNAHGDGTSGTGGARSGTQATSGAGSMVSAGTGGVHSIIIAAGGGTPIGGATGAAGLIDIGGATMSGTGGAAGSAPQGTGGTTVAIDAGRATSFDDGGAAPITRPEQCAHTQQFQCSSLNQPDQYCWCDPGAPLSQADCSPCSLFDCYSFTPPTGCYCVVCIH